MDGKKIALKKKKRKKSDSKLLSFGITSGLVLLLLILLYFYFHYYFFGGRITKYVEKREMISILCIGLDEAENLKKTDTLIIGLYYPRTRRFGLIALPRDLKVEIEERTGTRTLKINSIYSKYGVKRLLRVVGNLTGLDINFYVSIEIQDIIKIVDLVGGVDIYINKAMKYTDKSAGLNIELPRGIMKCDGLKALQFVRFRSDERGDMGRMERQYEFILNLIKKAVVRNNILPNLKLLKIIFKKVRTNLNFSDIINLIKYTSTADFNNIEMVLNGSGKAGIAKRIRDKLVRNGFNVIEFANAETQNYENTLILDRTGNMRKSLKIAGILKCRNVFPKINKFIMIDVTVIVGKDYKKHL